MIVPALPETALEKQLDQMPKRILLLQRYLDSLSQNEVLKTSKTYVEFIKTPGDGWKTTDANLKYITESG
jgi:hypothetical protein